MSHGADPALGLVVPDARQGPGPIPPSAVAALEPALDRLVSRTLPGARLARGTGEGSELSQLRPYTEGDDVRRLDAAASARTGTMHVRLHVPERALTTWIVVDLSASMAFGTATRLKADVAQGAALVFGRLGVRRTGSVGVVAFAGPTRAGSPASADTLRVLAPRGARRALVGLSRLLEAGVEPDLDAPAPVPAAAGPGEVEEHGFARALGRVLGLARTPGLVVAISDFREPRGWERPLGALRLRHAVIAVEVSDPRERELPDAGRLSFVDPESGRLVAVNTSSRRLRERFAAIEAGRRAAVAAELRRLAVHQISLSTDEDWLRSLGRQLR